MGHWLWKGMFITKKCQKYNKIPCQSNNANVVFYIHFRLMSDFKQRTTSLFGFFFIEHVFYYYSCSAKVSTRETKRDRSSNRNIHRISNLDVKFCLIKKCRTSLGNNIGIGLVFSGIVC